MFMRRGAGEFSRPVRLFILVSSLFLLLCVAGAVTGWRSMLSVRQEQARQLWAEQDIDHYEIEVAWGSAWNHGHVRAEVWDNRIISGVDLETGNSLVPLKLEGARDGPDYFVNVENLFRLIDAQMQPPTTWQARIARYHPQLAAWLAPCTVPLPTVSYADTYGYPAQIDYRGSPCFANTGVTVSVEHFAPLP